MTDQNSEDGLPPGWTVEVRVRKNGRRDKYYFAPSSGLKFDSRAKVFRYLNTPEVRNPRPRQNIKGTRKRSAKKLYTDPVSGYIFRSLKDASRYVETGELGRHAYKPKDMGIVGVELEDDNISSPAVAKKQKPEPSSTEEQKICDQSPKLDEKVQYEQILKSVLSECTSDQSGRPDFSSLF
ncbi:methyl-CpG-binding domain-containing protein 13-like isoform X8 [Juglans microcarpa x Juglans regia]|uniref:methyl-CpG-binding domain-containing protein 13-like isoform X8 n=1 Tax=Juglans microcarpa x Juglans regia TaxID=2249226 RepID=UPI001B7E0CE0|nr:methyl-CpG-binding domain-containing protein 13-like isoform X8 [Juglans microcarpa x Juglans regia]